MKILAGHGFDARQKGPGGADRRTRIESSNKKVLLGAVTFDVDGKVFTLVVSKSAHSGAGVSTAWISAMTPYANDGNYESSTSGMKLGLEGHAITATLPSGSDTKALVTLGDGQSFEVPMTELIFE